MLEQELKLHIPEGSRQAVVQQLQAIPGPRRQRLRALYFDTADRQLGKQLAALRLRLEGRRWVQTFKMAGADTLSRFELNHLRPGPVLDLSVYHDTPVAERFAKLKGELLVRYETDVMRLTRQVRVRQGIVELACDLGVLRAGELELPIAELEFELLRGRPSALFVVGQRWQRTHQLLLDLRSKAERGDRLASVALQADADSPGKAWADYLSPRRQEAVRLLPTDTAEVALRRMTAECLDQMARNAALATGIDGLPASPAVLADAIHQWRVGLRRLRSAWRLCRDWTPLPPEAWREQARVWFQQLGRGRDAYLWQSQRLPALAAAGMPPLLETIASCHEGSGASSPCASGTAEVPQAASPAGVGAIAEAMSGLAESAAEAAALLAGEAYQQWSLEILGWTVLPPSLSAGGGRRRSRSATTGVGTEASAEATERPSDPAAEPGLRVRLARRLRRWHRRLVREGRRFVELTDAERHEVRKLAKRLRYSLDFSVALLPRKRVKAYREQLTRVQDILGGINDDVVALERLKALTASQPQAWFGVGWLSAGLPAQYEAAAKTVRQLESLKPFWGKRLEA